MLETTSRMIWRLAPGGETWTLRPAELTLDVLTLGTYPLEMEIISFGASDKMYSPFFFQLFLRLPQLWLRKLVEAYSRVRFILASVLMKALQKAAVGMLAIIMPVQHVAALEPWKHPAGHRLPLWWKLKPVVSAAGQS